MQFPFKSKARSVVQSSWQKVAFKGLRIAALAGIIVHSPLTAVEAFQSTGMNFPLNGLIESQKSMSPGKALVLVSRGVSRGIVIGSEQHFKAAAMNPSYCTNLHPTQDITRFLEAAPAVGQTLSGAFRFSNALFGLPGALIGSAAQGAFMGAKEAISKGDAANSTLCGYLVTSRFDGYRHS